jgi:hypothetical protein
MWSGEAGAIPAVRLRFRQELKLRRTHFALGAPAWLRTKTWLVQLSSSPSSAAAIDSLAFAMN